MIRSINFQPDVLLHTHTRTYTHTVRYGSHKPLAHWLLHTLYCVVSLWQNALDPRGEFKCHLLLAFLTFKRKKRSCRAMLRLQKMSLRYRNRVYCQRCFFFFPVQWVLLSNAVWVFGTYFIISKASKLQIIFKERSHMGQSFTDLTIMSTIILLEQRLLFTYKWLCHFDWITKNYS